jgi:hypothetical protein
MLPWTCETVNKMEEGRIGGIYALKVKRPETGALSQSKETTNTEGDNQVKTQTPNTVKQSGGQA